MLPAEAQTRFFRRAFLSSTNRAALLRGCITSFSAGVSRLMAEAGFGEMKVLEASRTSIPDPGDLNLREREAESVHVEGPKP
jgi:hypothetical protein